MQDPFQANPNDEFPAGLKRAADYIEEHYAEKISLSGLAELAHFSKYHFHRLFHEHFGETVHERVCRVRLERAAHLLVSETQVPVARIADMCGFSSSQNFARAFKARYGISPTSARKNPGQIMIRNAAHTADTDEPVPPFKVEVIELPPCRVAYIRNIGTDASRATQRAFERLVQWAFSGRITDGLSVSLIAAGWSDISTTPQADRMIDACLPVGDHIEGDGDMGIQILPGGWNAVIHCEGRKSVIAAAWSHLLSRWLPESGYRRDDRPVYFTYYNNPHMNPRQVSLMDLCFPVRESAPDL